jgi:hypothetical protein
MAKKPIKKKPPRKASAKSAAGADGAKIARKKRPAAGSARLLPDRQELQDLYARYTSGKTFDEHDKAFYFVLDVGGVSRARQLIDHVAEVLAELEEFQG